jgi:hypothetical protein
MKLKSHFERIALSVVVLSSVWITTAYAAQLNMAVSVPAPTRAMAPAHGKSSKASATEKFGNVFLSRWLTTVADKRERLLWSSYPASIRGQTFSLQPPGNDPSMGGGW